MLKHPADIDELPWGQLELGTAHARLELDLRLGLALQESRLLRLRVLGGSSVLLVSLPLEAGWIRLSTDGLSLSGKRLADHGDTPIRAFVELLEDVAVTSEIGSKLALAANSRRLVISLLADDRSGYNDIVEWAPLIEASVYRIGAQLITVLDRIRWEVRDACAKDRPNAGELASHYRWLVNALGRTTLLSTDAGSTWLAGMAGSFMWVQWTPSFPLARERDRWATLIGARAASRFGPALIDRYLEALRRAQHPLNALDALVGLAAIGLRYPKERGVLVRSLEHDYTKLPNLKMLRLDIVATGHAEARRVLTEETPIHLSSVNRQDDAFNLDLAGHMPVFGLILGAIESPAWTFIPAPNEATPVSPRVARDSFVRAWGGVHPDLDSFPPWAFGRA